MVNYYYGNSLIILFKEIGKMKAFEFISKVEDGTIKVPKKHLDNLCKEIRVIILIDEKQIQPSQKKSQLISKKNALKAFQVRTKKLIFDRDEANKR